MIRENLVADFERNVPRNGKHKLQSWPCLDRKILRKLWPSHKKENEHFSETTGHRNMAVGFYIKIPIIYHKLKMLIRCLFILRCLSTEQFYKKRENVTIWSGSNEKQSCTKKLCVMAVGTYYPEKETTSLNTQKKQNSNVSLVTVHTALLKANSIKS